MCEQRADHDVRPPTGKKWALLRAHTRWRHSPAIGTLCEKNAWMIDEIHCSSVRGLLPLGAASLATRTAQQPLGLSLASATDSRMPTSIKDAGASVLRTDAAPVAMDWTASAVVVHSARTAVAAVSSLLVARLFGLPEGVLGSHHDPGDRAVVARCRACRAVALPGRNVARGVVGAIVAGQPGRHLLAFGASMFILGSLRVLTRSDLNGYRFGATVGDPLRVTIGFASRLHPSRPRRTCKFSARAATLVRIVPHRVPGRGDDAAVTPILQRLPRQSFDSS